MYCGNKIVRVSERDHGFFAALFACARQTRLPGDLACPQCFKRRLDVFPRSIDVTLDKPPERAYTTLHMGGIAVVHARLRALLEPLPACARGRVSAPDGTLLPEYASLYLRDLIRPRGVPGPGRLGFCDYSMCRRCEYSTVNSNSMYVLRRELPDAAVFQDRGSSLYLSEALAQRIPWHEFPEFVQRAIPVRDELHPDDEYASYDEARARLAVAFDGDWPAAFDAVECEARSVRMPEGPQRMGVVVRGINIYVHGLVRAGIMRIDAVQVG